VFRIGSISKTFTAIGLMQLWEEGRFGLDDPVNGYLRAFQVRHRDPDAPPVTFRHLLTHTAGIGEVRRLSDFLDVRRVFKLGAREDEPVLPLGDYYGGLLEPELPPGIKWAYANHGFATLGQLIEDISGVRFETYMRERVFEPLGMAHTDFVRSERIRPYLAAGYQQKRGLLRPAGYLEIAIRPAGSAFSSLADMSAYVQALLEGGRGVLAPETLRMMFEPHYQIDERLTAMGLAFWLDREDGRLLVHHGGGWPGFTSAMVIAPDEGAGALAFTNVSTLVAPHAIAMRLLRRALGLAEPASRLPRPGVLERPFVRSELVGPYGPLPGLLTNARAWMAFGGEAWVSVRGNRLSIGALIGPLRDGITLYQMEPGDPLAYEGVFAGEPVRVVFHPDATGRIESLSLGGILGPVTLYKRSIPESVRFRTTAALGTVAGAAVAFGIRCIARARRQERTP
jgi:CubicO group peptidase (beta-lactamase class C family)